MLVGFDFQLNISSGNRIDFYFCFCFFSNTLDVNDYKFIWGPLTIGASSVPCTNCIFSEGLCCCASFAYLCVATLWFLEYFNTFAQIITLVLYKHGTTCNPL